MRKPSTEEEAREWLAAAADFLTKVPYASDALRHTAAAINAYLSEHERSLEGALGLKSDGRRRRSANRTERNFRLAKKATAMRMLNSSLTWKQISDDMSREENVGVLDERELRRWCETYRDEVLDSLSIEWNAQFDEHERLAKLAIRTRNEHPDWAWIDVCDRVARDGGDHPIDPERLLRWCANELGERPEILAEQWSIRFDESQKPGAG